MATADDDETTACCPGKVLLAGGYLVLESPNPGIVLAADGETGSSRFFATVSARPSAAPTVDAASSAAAAAAGGAAAGEEDGTAAGPAEGYSRTPLDVHSPQFDDVFRYWLDYTTAEPMTTEDDDDGDGVLLRLSPRSPKEHSPNPYVERTLSLTLAFVQRTLGPTQFASRLATITTSSSKEKEEKILSVKLRAGNDFYSPLTHLESRNLPATPGNVASLLQFLPCPKVEGKVVVNKTGMGSSAALVTSLVGAVLSYFGIVALPKLGIGGGGECDQNPEHNNDGKKAAKSGKEGQRLSHNLAQICHCSAQGKVGSGFDVSAAVHGTHVYRRFSKSVLADLLERIDSSNSSTSDGGPVDAASSSTVTKDVVHDLATIVTDDSSEGGAIWDAKVDPIHLPPGLEILMADVCGGSESPSMARKVLAWKKKQGGEEEGDDDPLEEENYWDRLRGTNAMLEKLFRFDLADRHVREGLVEFGPTRLAQVNSDGWADICGNRDDNDAATLRRAATALLDVRSLFKAARTDLKGMGEAADVPIEPNGQTALADATMALPGVVAAGVPGAGGYDALFALYVKGPEVEGGKSDEVRERIGELWRGWGDERRGADDGVDVVCPLAVRGAGSGGNFGLCESDLGW